MSDELKEISQSVPSGLKTLIEGYADYAAEVVLERAIPAIDGLKPSQRRILYTMYRNNNTHLTKSANVVGEVMKLHPHGDGAIYDTLVHLVDEGHYMNVPYISGKGNYGRVTYNEPPAASRYTECMLSHESALLFGEMDGVDMIPSYDNKFTEPATLPVAFPSILVNPSQGIAVGLASNIPSYNLSELIEATIELIETGGISKPLAPDFPNGAVYIRDDTELKRIMKRGKGKIKLRGKWHIEGKSIIIDELPYYTNVERIMKVMNLEDSVADVRDETDFNGLRLVIECKAKTRVNEALTVLLRDTSMQMTISTNISVIIGGKPRTLGVTELLKEWVAYRKKVLKKQLTYNLQTVGVDIDKYTLLVALLKNKDALNQYIEAVKVSEAAGRKFLFDFLQAPAVAYDWVMSLSFKTISNAAAKEKKLADLKEEQASIKRDLENIEGVICRQLREISKKYYRPRKTDIGSDDYTYNRAEKSRPAAVRCFVVINDKFIKKYQTKPDTKAIECKSDDSILFVDNQSRILRLDLSGVEFYKNGSGHYLPVLLGIPDDFNVLDYHKESREKDVYLYRDGYVSIIDWGSRIDSGKKYKVYRGAVPSMIEDAFTYLPKTPYVVCYTANKQIGVAETVFMEKSASARTKLITVGVDDYIKYACGVTAEELQQLFPQYEKYLGKCKRLKKIDTFDFTLFKELLSRASRN